MPHSTSFPEQGPAQNSVMSQPSYSPLINTEGNTSHAPINHWYSITPCLILHLFLLPLFRQVWKIFSFVNVYFLQSSKIPRYNHPSENGTEAWALVTNASHGIGLAIAGLLAEGGYNVVLHGVNQNELLDAMSKLHNEFPCRSFRFFVADPAVLGQEDLSLRQKFGAWRLEREIDLDSIKYQLSRLNLTVVIHTADCEINGAGHDPKSLSEKTEASLNEEINLNATFPIQLVRILLPTLIENAPALVMNIIYLKAINGEELPLHVCCSASKSFIAAMTKSLALEMKLEGHDVEVLCVMVPPTSHDGERDDETTDLGITTSLARTSLARVGCGESVIFGLWNERLKKKFRDMWPRRLQEKQAMDLMRKIKREMLQRR